MKKLYKLYIGELISQGLPESAILKAVVAQENLRAKVNQLARQLLEGQDLYLVFGEEVSAYKRDGLDKIFS